jgi:hypothetical protein
VMNNQRNSLRTGGRGESPERSRADLTAFQDLLIAERCGLV